MVRAYSRYTVAIGNTMAYEWWCGHRKTYWRLQKYLHMSLTGSRIVKQYGSGPFPTERA